MPTGLTILGKSDATVAIILDILQSKGLFPDIDIVNNLDTPIDHSFDNKFFNFRIVKEIEDYKSRFALGVTSAAAKQAILESFNKEDFNWVNLIHGASVVASTVTLGTGNIMGPLSVISAHTIIKNFVSINRSVNIGHHCLLEDFVTISPGCSIGGHVYIGKGSTIGIGASIVHKVSIGKNSVIGAGSVVTRDIPDNVVAFGVPCKVVKENG